MGNAVYCSEDKRGVLHRRIAAVNHHGKQVTVEGREDKRVTKCSHDDIIYLRRYSILAGMMQIVWATNFTIVIELDMNLTRLTNN